MVGVTPLHGLGLPKNRVRIWVGWNFHTGEVKKRSECIKNASWSDAFFVEELKVDIFKFRDL